MDSRFMNEMADLIAAHGIAVVRFEFPYMASRRTTGKKKPAPKAELLCDAYRKAMSDLAAEHPAQVERPMFIGGKSMGGRVASLVADALHDEGTIKGLVCIGYPFHPPKLPEKQRTAHLEAMRCPALVLQGERDPFGTREEVAAYALSAAIEVAWIGDGDHDLGPRGGHGFTRKGNLTTAAERIAAFVRSH